MCPLSHVSISLVTRNLCACSLPPLTYEVTLGLVIGFLVSRCLECPHPVSKLEVLNSPIQTISLAS